MKENTCCFFGHRKIEDTARLAITLHDVIEHLIVDKRIDTFLFGSKSEFNTLCYEVVTKLKEKYVHIKRIYVRAEFPYINDEYRSYLLKGYEDTYYPDNMVSAGKAAYVERNCEMIDNSYLCVVYYKPDYSPLKSDNGCHKTLKSGTKIAYDYAARTKKIIINISDFK